jgi:hypothetical protein
LEGALNVTEGSDLQLEKQALHTTSTDAGTWTVCKLLSANADSSIRCNFEFDSNGNRCKWIAIGKTGLTHDFDSGFNHNCNRSAEIRNQRSTTDIFNERFMNLKLASTRSE